MKEIILLQDIPKLRLVHKLCTKFIFLQRNLYYFRFLDVTLNRDNNITTGKIYQHVINKERKGDYLGKTVQVKR